MWHNHQPFVPVVLAFLWRKLYACLNTSLSLSPNYLITCGLAQSLEFTVLVIHLLDLQPLLHICAGYKGYIPISDVKLQPATWSTLSDISSSHTTPLLTEVTFLSSHSTLFLPFFIQADLTTHSRKDNRIITRLEFLELINRIYIFFFIIQMIT